MKEDIGNIKTNKGTWFKVFWDNLKHSVEFKKRPNGRTYYAPYANNEVDAKINAKQEADNNNF